MLILVLIIIAAILWSMHQNKHADKIEKYKQLAELSTFEVDNDCTGYWMINFDEMTSRKVGYDYGDSDSNANVRRDGAGNWFAQLTNESRKEAIAHCEFMRDNGWKLYDAEYHNNILARYWAPIHIDYSGRIEAAYQKYLHSLHR